MPAKGEALRVGSIEQINNDPWTRKALMMLVAEKAPPSVAQLVLWNVADGFEWESVARYAGGWANPFEMALARDFADRLREGKPAMPPRLQWELTTRSGAVEPLAAGLRRLLETRRFLGLESREGIAARPEGPALACRVRLQDRMAVAQFSVTEATAERWVSVGEISIKLGKESGGGMSPEALADALADAMLTKLVRVTLVGPSRGKGKASGRLRIENGSPLILKGLTVAGADQASDAARSTLLGITLPPHRALEVPARPEMVRRLGLSQGVRVQGVELGSL